MSQGRRAARKTAVEILFESWQRDIELPQMLRERINNPSQDQPVTGYTQEIIIGVAEQLDQIIELINTYSKGWPFNRMPMVDRAILVVAIWEILFQEEIPDGVAMSEAVHIAQKLSTDQSPKFINGLLGKLSSQKDSLLL